MDTDQGVAHGGADVSAERAGSQPPPLPAQAAGPIIYCTQCGQQNPENNHKCVRCGAGLHESPALQYIAAEDGTMGGLIPYKNAAALWAYYLGIFSLIPCVGIPLGIAALVLGLKGLKHQRMHPEARGRGHAWTGIVLGGLCAVVYTLLTAIPLVMLMLG